MTDLDNRDLSTTRIWQEVAVWELIDNALENAGFPEGIGSALYDYFDTHTEDTIKSMDLQERLVDLGMFLQRHNTP